MDDGNDGSQERLNTTQKSAEIFISKIAKYLAEVSRPLSWVEKTKLGQAVRLKFEEIDGIMNSSELSVDEKVQKVKKAVFSNGLSLDKNKEKSFEKSLEKALGKRIKSELKIGEVSEEKIENFNQVKSNIRKKKFNFAPKKQKPVTQNKNKGLGIK